MSTGIAVHITAISKLIELGFSLTYVAVLSAYTVGSPSLFQDFSANTPTDIRGPKLLILLSIGGGNRF